MRPMVRWASLVGALGGIFVALAMWASATASGGSVDGIVLATGTLAVAALSAGSFVVHSRGHARALEASVQREREFAGHLAHELRTPLAILKTELQVEQQSHPNDAQRHAALGAMVTTVDEMTSLVENLLMLARLERESDPSKLGPVQAHALVEQLWRRLEPKARRRGLQWSNALPQAHTLQADAGHLRLVLSNLLSNAVSYTEEGGRIEVRATQGGALEVWDSGPQLASDQLERVFERLWRADTARTDAAKHTGLGLALARALCRHMSLDLEARNTPGGGLTFTILPRR